MHIGIPAARRCINSFQEGVLIFAPLSYTKDPAVSFPDNGTSPYEVRKLTMLAYYSLVLCSLTGLCTILGQTRLVDAREGGTLTTDRAALQHRLHPTEPLSSYLVRRVGSPVSLLRRFEYRFRLVGLHVIMLHYFSEADRRLHLVEVYEGPHERLLWGCLLYTSPSPRDS